MKFVKLSFCLFMLLTSTIAFSQPAAQIDAPQQPKVFAYYAGWSQAAIPDMKFNYLLLSFALLQKGGSYYTDYSRSGNFQLPSDHGPYLKWNQWAKKWRAKQDGNGLAIVSYGGATNREFRSAIVHADHQTIMAIAGEIKANLDKYYFDGVDLDIEDWWSYNHDDNVKFANNLAALVKELKKSLVADGKGYKIIMVTVGYTAADKSAGGYGGSMIPYFSDKQAMAATDSINLMSYAITDLTAVKQVLNTFVSAGVDKHKLMFGVDSSKLASANVAPIGKYIKDNQYGGLFLWGIGTDNKQNSSAMLQAMKQSLGVN